MDGYEFKVLQEIAADKDEFEGATHDNVAKRLSKLIMSENNGFTIGLEGGWGSGKSTVVNLLGNYLNKDTLMFKFDAWAHEGDPLRRIFLEDFITNLDPLGSDEELNSIKRKTTGRAKTVTVSTNSKTSKLGGFLSLSALLVPLGASILSTLNFSTLKDYSVYTLASGISLAAAPIIVLILWQIFSKPTNNGSRFNPFLKRDMSVFTSSTQENYTQDITEDNERTSIEFESIFHEIVKYEFEVKKDKKRIVIVIDNLDRIEAEKALSIWSILQTFFQKRDDGSFLSDGWNHNLWFLVPFDRDALTKIWNSNDNSKVSESYFEKCFQVIDEVPYPVMSTWINFFDKLLEASLHSWPELDIKKVRDTYHLINAKNEVSPTPRSMQAFVNKIGLLGMRWGGEMDAAVIALYAYYKSTNSYGSIKEILLSENFSNDYVPSLKLGEIKIQLSGILFGVPKDKGIQILLEPEIKSSLFELNKTTLSSLIELHGDAFWATWYACRNKYLRKENTAKELIIITQSIHEAESSNKSKFNTDLKSLSSGWQESLDRLGAFDCKEISDPIDKLLDNLDDSSLITSLEQYYNRSIEKVISTFCTEGLQSNVFEYLDSIRIVIEKHGGDINNKRFKDFTLITWKSWLLTLESKGVDFWHVKPSENIIQEFIGDLSGNNLTTDKVEVVIKTYKYISTDEKWSEYVAKLSSILTSGQFNDAIDSVAKVINFLVRKSKVDSALLKNALINNNFVNRINQLDVKMMPQLIAMFAIHYQTKLFTECRVDKVKSYFSTNKLDEISSEVFEEVERFNPVVLWRLSEKSPNNLILEYIKNEGSTKLFSETVAIEYIHQFTGNDCINLINNLIEHGGISPDFPTEDIYEARVGIQLVNKHVPSVGKLLVDRCSNEMIYDDWVNDFSTDMMISKMISKKANHKHKDAVIKFFQKEFESSCRSDLFWDNIEVILSKVMDRKEVTRELMNQYFKSKEALDRNKRSVLFKTFLELNSFSDLTADLVNAKLELVLDDEDFDSVSKLLDFNVNISDKSSESLVSRIKGLYPKYKEDSVFGRLLESLNLDKSFIDEAEELVD